MEHDPAPLAPARAASEEGSAPSGRHGSPWVWAALGAGAAALALALLALLGHRVGRLGEARLPGRRAQAPAAATGARSVAVLPFENLADDKESGYFADGVQDEILTRLAKIGALKVISRTSTLHYATHPANLPQVARELGVGSVLEGSVRRAGDTVRLNVQLIDAATDRPLWAESYDRQLTDLFDVQSDVASAVASQLRARLSPAEQQAVAQRPTENLDAYDAYLRGLAYSRSTISRTESDVAARRFLGEAVRLDPNFALAWAKLAVVSSWAYRVGTLPKTAALIEEARVAAETACRLQPTLGEALLARGYFSYACLNDYAAAEGFYQRARAVLPNDPQVSEYLGYLTRRRLEWDRSAAYFDEAVRQDPRNAALTYQHAILFIAMRRWTEALDTYDRVLALTPDDHPVVIANQAAIYQARGEIPRAANLLGSVPPEVDDYDLTYARFVQARLERRFGDALALVRHLTEDPEAGDEPTRAARVTDLGLAQRAVGDMAGARATWEKARDDDRALLVEQPGNQEIIGTLALTEAYLGNKDEALRLAQRAADLARAASDRVNEYAQLEILAQVCTEVGEHARAVELLGRLVTARYFNHGPRPPLTQAGLRLDPVYDPLRGEAGFRRLVGE